MIPVFQTRYGDPMGNCWEACIASILEIDLEEVPDGRPEGKRATWEESQRWLYEREWRVRGMHGLMLVHIAYGEDMVFAPLPDADDQHYIQNGRNSAGVAHSVVALGSAIVHNPNQKPDGALVSIDSCIVLLECGMPVDLPFVPHEEEFR